MKINLHATKLIVCLILIHENIYLTYCSTTDLNNIHVLYFS